MVVATELMVRGLSPTTAKIPVWPVSRSLNPICSKDDVSGLRTWDMNKML